MSVDTKLFISSIWELEDVQVVLENHLGIKAKLVSQCSISSAYFNLQCDNGRLIHCHYDADTPVGNCILLSTTSNVQGIKILQEIAKVLGGFLNREDTNEEYELFNGMFWAEDGLTYHYKYAVLHNEVVDNDDIDGLQASMRKWCEKHRR